MYALYTHHLITHNTRSPLRPPLSPPPPTHTQNKNKQQQQQTRTKKPHPNHIAQYSSNALTCDVITDSVKRLDLVTGDDGQVGKLRHSANRQPPRSSPYLSPQHPGPGKTLENTRATKLTLKWSSTTTRHWSYQDVIPDTGLTKKSSQTLVLPRSHPRHWSYPELIPDMISGDGLTKTWSHTPVLPRRGPNTGVTKKWSRHRSHQ